MVGAERTYNLCPGHVLHISMLRYNYKFFWVDKQTNKRKHAYLDASSKDAAIKLFEDEYKLDYQRDGVKVVRVP